MRWLFLFLPISVIAYDMNLIFEKNIKFFPNKEGVFIDKFISIPYKIKNIDGFYLISGDKDEIENYLNNNTYVNYKIKKYNIITLHSVLSKIYLSFQNINCKVLSVSVLTPLFDKKIIFKPFELNLKYKLKLECKE